MPTWNHNIHYHDFILENLPQSKTKALDIGSGDGLFASKLTRFFNEVVCLEPDKESYKYSKKEHDSNPRMEHKNITLDDYDVNGSKHDLITSIASIHHMDLEQSLSKMKMMLTPNGKLVILGLYKESSFVDYFLSAIAIVPNLIKTMLSEPESTPNYSMKVTPAKMTIKEIKEVASNILGNYSFKRHLFWRYSIVYPLE